MSNEGLKLKLEEIKFDANGNLIISNKELISKVKKSMEAVNLQGLSAPPAVRGFIDILCN